MSLITTKDNTELNIFEPLQTGFKVSQAEAAIEFGKKTGNIEMVETAIDALCNERYNFLAWWGSEERRGGDQSNRSVTLQTYGLEKMTVARWRKKHGTAEQSEATKHAMIDKARRMIDGTDSIHGNKSIVDDWYTPSQFIEVARATMGAIDLDPATSVYAQKTVNAKKYFTEDALNKNWKGRVWLNPPFSDVLGFADKLISHLETGEVPQAIVLTNNNTDTLWWHKLAELSQHICFTKGRISFYNKAGEARGNTNGHTFFYFGDSQQAFIDNFYPYGLVLK